MSNSRPVRCQVRCTVAALDVRRFGARGDGHAGLLSVAHRALAVALTRGRRSAPIIAPVRKRVAQRAIRVTLADSVKHNAISPHHTGTFRLPHRYGFTFGAFSVLWHRCLTSTQQQLSGVPEANKADISTPFRLLDGHIRLDGKMLFQNSLLSSRCPWLGGEQSCRVDAGKLGKRVQPPLVCCHGGKRETAQAAVPLQ